jgi:hypothetical protein
MRDLDNQTFTTFDNLLYDLHRHIEFDDDEHGPRTLQHIDNPCGNNNLARRAAEEEAQPSLRKQTTLSDGAVRAIEFSVPRAA